MINCWKLLFDSIHFSPTYSWLETFVIRYLNHWYLTAEKKKSERIQTSEFEFFIVQSTSPKEAYDKLAFACIYWLVRFSFGIIRSTLVSWIYIERRICDDDKNKQIHRYMCECIGEWMCVYCICYSWIVNETTMDLFNTHTLIQRICHMKSIEFLCSSLYNQQSAARRQPQHSSTRVVRKTESLF